MKDFWEDFVEVFMVVLDDNDYRMFIVGYMLLLMVICGLDE